MSSNFKASKEFFTFSKSERRGILVLTILIIVLIIAPYPYRYFFTNTPAEDFEFKTKVDSFFANITVKADDNTYSLIKTIEDEEIVQSSRIDYFSFDPNSVRIEEMVQLGLSVKQAQVIERYRNKGGIFHSPDDFKKIYVIDTNLFKSLKPWIKIDPNYVASKAIVLKDSIAVNLEAPIIVELNLTDTIELTKLKGIGRVFARRIIAYRNLLGGFVNVRQLSEVYGIKSEALKEISKSIKVDSSLVKTININLVTFEEIKKHPYISEYQAKAIVYYRSKVGSIKSINELFENKILPTDKFPLLKLYLNI